MQKTLKTAKDVQYFFDSLTPEEKKKLAIRENFNARAIFQINRNGLQGTFTFSQTSEFKDGEGWQKVGEKEPAGVAIPADLMMQFAGIALSDERVQKQLVDYYGEMPDLSKIENADPANIEIS